MSAKRSLAVGWAAGPAPAVRPEDGPDARHHLLETERLGDVVVPAGRQSRDLVLGAVLGGEEHDRDVPAPTRAAPGPRRTRPCPASSRRGPPDRGGTRAPGRAPPGRCGRWRPRSRRSAGLRTANPRCWARRRRRAAAGSWRPPPAPRPSRHSPCPGRARRGLTSRVGWCAGVRLSHCCVLPVSLLRHGRDSHVSSPFLPPVALARGACPRAWPPHERPGWCGLPRPAPGQVPVAPASARSTGRRHRAVAGPS